MFSNMQQKEDIYSPKMSLSKIRDNGMKQIDLF